MKIATLVDSFSRLFLSLSLTLCSVLFIVLFMSYHSLVLFLCLFSHFQLQAVSTCSSSAAISV